MKQIGNKLNVEFMSLEVIQYLYSDEAWASKEFQVPIPAHPERGEVGLYLRELDFFERFLNDPLLSQNWLAAIFLA